MATHSSVLAWRIPGTGEPGGLPSMGLHRVGHDWSDLAAAAAAEITINILNFTKFSVIGYFALSQKIRTLWFCFFSLFIIIEYLNFLFYVKFYFILILLFLFTLKKSLFSRFHCFWWDVSYQSNWFSLEYNLFFSLSLIFSRFTMMHLTMDFTWSN